MRPSGALLLLAALLAAGTVGAEAPERSIRPEPRAAVEVVVAAQAQAAGRDAAVVANAPVRIGDPDAQAVYAGIDAAEASVVAAAEPAADVRLSSMGSLVGLRARPRPETLAVPGTIPFAVVPEAERPRPRPASFVRQTNPARQVEVVQAISSLAILRSPRPVPRPENHARRSVVLAAAMIPTQPNPGAITGRRGSVCGDPGIRGETIAPIRARIQGCGLQDGVRVTEVDGVRLSTPATIDCTTAQALNRWVRDTVKPTVGRLGGGVESLEVFAHYACRTRNNQKGARVSEHGRGRAIDIGAITLRNGASISVLDHWRDSDLGQLLRAMHRGACGPFGTVLGPAADRFHQNHFHFDTARYRSGAYCR